MNLHAAAPRLSVDAFNAWVADAPRGDRLEYHSGFLAIDREEGRSNLSPAARKRCNELANVAAKAAAESKVALVQRRIGPGAFSYIAERARPTKS